MNAPVASAVEVRATDQQSGPQEPADLRLLVLGAVAWLGALAGSAWPGPLRVVGLTVLLMCAVGCCSAFVVPALRGARPWVLTVLAFGLVGATVTTTAALRSTQAEDGVIAAAAAAEHRVEVVATVVRDPRPRTSHFGESGATVGLRIREVVTRDGPWRVRNDVVLLGEESWLEAELGSTVATRGRLVALDGAVLLRATGPPEVRAGPSWWWRAAEHVRAGIRTAVEDRPDAQRVLVPSLVVGDDAGIDPGLAEDFRTTGLTHLLAVSGTNLTLLLGCGLLLAQWCGVRGRGTYMVAALCVVGFVLIARSEPSVVRAATMGTVAIFALTRNGRRRGVRSLGAAVVLLLLWDPAMSRSVGFALSVLATGGILLLAPVWRVSMARWMPDWAAAGIAVPAAAQLTCTPVVSAIQGEVSLVAVVANILVAPAVAPATVLGLLGGLVAMVLPWLGQLIALPGAWSVGWIVLVARWGAGLQTPAVEWGTTAWPLAALAVGCVLLAVVAPWVLARGWLVVPGTALLALVILMGPPARGWPPHGWVMAVCDVGQGDAMVVRTGPGEAIVVDAGPDARLVRRCLDRLGVERIPLLVLTHFHADHVDGLPGVLAGRQVARVEVSPVADPPGSAVWVGDVLTEHGLVAYVGAHGVVRTAGAATVEHLWPPPDHRPTGAVGDRANDASVVLLVEVHGVRLLLTGDIEPPAQKQLARRYPGLEVDVLKVPHHGSRHQDLDFLRGLGASVLVVGVGEENTYGHPSVDVLDALTDGGGVSVLRTDEHADAVVVERDGDLFTHFMR